MKLEFSGQFFEEPSNIKFHENPSSGKRGVPCEQTDRHMDMTKTVVVFAIIRTLLQKAPVTP
jgi:hypothetical protein